MKYTKLLIAVSAIPLALALGGCKHNSATASGPGGGGSGPSLAEGSTSAIGKDGNPVDAAQAMDTKTDGKYQALQANATTSTEVDISGSTYSGRFYGPNADQVGGAINVTGTSDPGTVVGQV